jgi:hypothetical protein
MQTEHHKRLRDEVLSGRLDIDRRTYRRLQRRLAHDGVHARRRLPNTVRLRHGQRNTTPMDLKDSSPAVAFDGDCCYGQRTSFLRKWPMGDKSSPEQGCSDTSPWLSASWLLETLDMTTHDRSLLGSVLCEPSNVNKAMSTRFGQDVLVRQDHTSVGTPEAGNDENSRRGMDLGRKGTEVLIMSRVGPLATYELHGPHEQKRMIADLEALDMDQFNLCGA